MTTTTAPMSETTDLGSALAAFQRDYPSFESTHVLDQLRTTDYARLDAQRQVYLWEGWVPDDFFQAAESRAHLPLPSAVRFSDQFSISTMSVTGTQGRSSVDSGVRKRATIAATRPMLR